MLAFCALVCVVFATRHSTREVDPNKCTGELPALGIVPNMPGINTSPDEIRNWCMRNRFVIVMRAVLGAVTEDESLTYHSHVDKSFGSVFLGSNDRRRNNLKYSTHSVCHTHTKKECYQPWFVHAQKELLYPGVGVRFMDCNVIAIAMSLLLQVTQAIPSFTAQPTNTNSASQNTSSRLGAMVNTCPVIDQFLPS